jgi:hypothetical protein
MKGRLFGIAVWMMIAAGGAVLTAAGASNMLGRAFLSSWP